MADEQMAAALSAPAETTTTTTTAAPANDAPKQSVEDFIGKIYDDEPAETNNADAAPAQAVASASDDKPAEPEKAIGTDGEDDQTSEPTNESAIAGPLMSAKDREAFNKLSPEMQKWITERDRKVQADYTRTKQDLAKQRQSIEQLDRVLAPHRQKFAHMGASEAQVVNQLLTLADHADRDFVGFVQEQARLRGLPLEAFSKPGQPADPQLVAMQRQLQGVTNVVNQQQQRTQEQQLQSVSSAIEAFTAEKSAQGESAFPFYSELETDMIPIVATLRQSKPGLQPREYLVKAYKMALADNDAVSAKVEADRTAKAEAARIAQAKKAADAAKKAAGTTVKSSGALPKAAQHTRNIDDFIGALVDERMTA